MQRRVAHGVVITAFALCGGHAGWSALGPGGARGYVIGGPATTLRSPDRHARNLYLRRVLHLTQRPSHAWIRVIGFDHVQLYLNGRLMARRHEPGLPVAIVADLTPRLRAGRNVLGVVARSDTLDQAPRVAIDGAYRLRDGAHRIDAQGPWRCATVFERRAAYWYSARFDDSHWPPPDRGAERMTAVVTDPPRAMTTPNAGRWITAEHTEGRPVVVRRTFHVPERVAHAWVRLHSATPYRLAINGTVVDVRHRHLGTDVPGDQTWWIYDVSAIVRSGDNVVSLLLDGRRRAPLLMLDMEATGRSGLRYRLASDQAWRYRLAGDDWLAPREASRSWHRCRVVLGDAGIPAWRQSRRVAEITWPWALRLRRCAAEAGLVVLLAAVAWALSRLVCSHRGRCAGSRRMSPAVLALVPSTILMAAAMIVTNDPRVPVRWVYRPALVVAAAGLLLVQWAVIAVADRRRAAPRGSVTGRSGWLDRRRVRWAALVVLVIAGGYLRLRDLAARPLSPDEVTMHRATMGFLRFGFPAIVIHDDLPVAYRATSELVYVGPALATLVFQNERLVVRVPAAVWGIATIVLIFYVGARMFTPPAGLVAAAIYALSPYCAGMANFARYYSQLQALALLTVYFFWRTIAPPGPLNRRALWTAVVLFVCMYLSWEGSALLAPGLMAAALLHRRDRARTLFCDPHVWAGMAVVCAVVLVQGSFRTLVQITRPLFGSGASDVAVTPMWRLPGFDLWYYVRAASWNRDTLLPVSALVAAVTLALRHQLRKPARYVFVVFLATAFLQALVLPVSGKRYAYSLLPLWVMLASAVLSAAARVLARVQPLGRAPAPGSPACWATRSPYGRCVAVLLVAAFVTLGSGLLIDLSELRDWRIAGKGLRELKTPAMQPCVAYVRQHMQTGDIVLANAPHVVNQYLGRKSDYWVQTQMHLQATLDDRRPVPLHRLAGTVLLPDLEHLRHVFQRHRRIWFIVSTAFHARTNIEATSEFLRSRMKVVYEDYSAMVLFYGDTHPPPAVRAAAERSLKRTRAPYLP